RLEQVAREAGMSKFYFSRQFKAATGASFRGFLARRRVARAVALLGEGKRSVSEVSQDVGFKDLSHFSRVFHLLTGQPPSRYRKAVRRMRRDPSHPARPDESKSR
ncbi:MAG TPA: AraC family transcriptional regulator, partial [Candidatus Sulfotelmatobacter sp.]|nr:AraC family transcriptional regulator [Candidatus Sulfotelmatobacter sp.]